MAAHGYTALASPAAATPSAAAEHSVVVCLATDVLGAKVNYEVAFASAPTLAAVVPVAQAVFDAAYAAQGSARRFAAQRWQLYDDEGGRWVSLRKEPWATAPLPHGAQVYALQEGWEAEEQAPIPNPTQPPPPPTPTPAPRQQLLVPQRAAEAPLASAAPATPAAAAAAAVTPAAKLPPSLAVRPRVEAAAVVPAVTPVAAAASTLAAALSSPLPQPSTTGGRVGAEELEEVCLGEGGTEDDASKAAALFHELNVRGDGAMDAEEFSRGLRRMDMPFAEESLREVFEKADLDRDGRLSKDEWSALLKAQPNLCDSLYYRSREYVCLFVCVFFFTHFFFDLSLTLVGGIFFCCKIDCCCHTHHHSDNALTTTTVATTTHLQVLGRRPAPAGSVGRRANPAAFAGGRGGNAGGVAVRPGGAGAVPRCEERSRSGMITDFFFK